MKQGFSRLSRAFFGDDRESYADAFRSALTRRLMHEWQRNRLSVFYASFSPLGRLGRTWAALPAYADTLETAVDLGN